MSDLAKALDSSEEAQTARAIEASRRFVLDGDPKDLDIAADALVSIGLLEIRILPDGSREIRAREDTLDRVREIMSGGLS